MITFFVQLIIPLALMFYRFNRRKHFVLRVVLFGVLFFGLSAAWYDPDCIPFIPRDVEMYLYFVTGYVFAFLYVFACFDMPVLNILFYCLAAFLVQNFSHHTFELIMRLSNVPISGEYDNVWYLLALAGVYTVVYSAVFIGYVRKIEPEDFMRLPTVTTLLLAGAFFLVMIFLGIYIRHINTSLIEVYAVGVGYELYSVILDTFILCLLAGVFRNGRLKESNELLAQRVEREARYYETAKANMDLVNIKCHDLKHQIAALENMHGEERKRSIDELKETALIYDSIAKTGNEALDCLLTEKSVYCQSNNINFTYIADGALLSAMKYGDIYALFGNILDNAVESVMKEPDEKKRIIGLKLFSRGGKTCIHVENYCAVSPEFEDGLPKTTKKEAGHGYGMKSIAYIVKKYGGNFTATVADGNIFSLDILLGLTRCQPR